MNFHFWNVDEKLKQKAGLCIPTPGHEKCLDSLFCGRLYLSLATSVTGKEGNPKYPQQNFVIRRSRDRKRKWKGERRLSVLLKPTHAVSMEERADRGTWWGKSAPPFYCSYLYDCIEIIIASLLSSWSIDYTSQQSRNLLYYYVRKTLVC